VTQPRPLVRLSTAASTFRIASGALLAGAVAFLSPTLSVGAQVAIKRAPSGFNLFSVQQDVEIGRQSAADLERRLQLVTSTRTSRYLASIGSLLAAQVPGAAYPFEVRVVNTPDVNAFVLPGGQIFLTGGLLSLTRSEAEVAGLLAHAMGHVVLRHGTARASKAYLSKAGLSALGGLVGRTAPTSSIVNAVGGYGLNPVFLKFNRPDEYEADALGAELMSKAGYDPVAMATILATLRREGARAPGIDRFNSSHPPIADRERRIRNLSNVLGHGRSDLVGGFNRMRWHGGGMASTRAATEQHTSAGSVELRSTRVAPDIPAPSPQFTRFSSPDALVTIEYPSNWDPYHSGLAMSFAPSGGVIDGEDGAPNLRQGAIVNQYAPFEDDVGRWNNSLTRHYAPFADRSRPRGALEDATDDLVRQILDVYPWLSAPTGSARSELVDGMRGYSVRLSGRSPLTGEMERVTVYTTALPDDHVVYMACVAHGRTATTVERACARMIQSLRVNEAALNRQ
jgi:Zn-dependent protease with chaperone function